MKVLDKKTIEGILSKASIEDLVTYIENAYISYSSKKAIVPPVGTLTFEKPPGDVHIKYGYIKNEPHYVIKIASGFYDNPKLGLPSSNGLNLVFSQRTGSLETILLDEGLLTDVRTGLGGAVAAKHLATSAIAKIGIVGTGIQARLQLKYISYVMNCKNALAWGRSAEKLQQFKTEMSKHGFNIETTTDIDRISRECRLIVTTTPSQSPLIGSEELQSGTLIIAVGADTLGKQELDNSILQKADFIVMDSTIQCRHHGEIHKAIKADLLGDATFMELGDVISTSNFNIPEQSITVVDLTGIATQDIQISKFILDNLQ